MANAQLLTYINQCLEQNLDQEQIKAKLIKVGWQTTDITEAFSAIASLKQTVSPIINSPISLKTDKNEKKKLWHLPSIKLNKTSIIIISFLVVLLIASGVLAYFYYSPSPEVVMNKAIDRLSSINALAYANEIAIEFTIDKSLTGNPLYSGITGTNNSTSSTSTSPSDKVYHLTLDLNGQTDFQSSLKSLTAFKIHINELFGGAPFGVEIRNIGDWAYLNLDLPNLGIVDLSVLNNQWIKVAAPSTIGKILNFQEAKNSSSTPGSSQENMKWLLEKSAQLKSSLSGSQAFQLNKVLPNEKINGSDTYHYSFTVNKNGLEKFITESSKIISGKDMSAEEIANIKKGIADTDLVNGEIWIGRNDFYPYKLLLTLAIKNQESSIVKINQINLTFSAKDFNKPFDVKEPESSKTLEEAMQEFSGPLMGNMTGTSSAEGLNLVNGSGSGGGSGNIEQAKASARDAQRLSDIQQIQTALEMYYNDSNSYPDTLNFGGPLTYASRTYIQTIPENPKPNDGLCPSDFEYSYLLSSDKQNYKLTYCLGSQTGMINSGLNIATANGIQTKSDNLNGATSPASMTTSSLDTDADGLSDYEEVEIYHTDPLNPDTDADGFSDGQEIKSGYNPNGSGKLK